MKLPKKPLKLALYCVALLLTYMLQACQPLRVAHERVEARLYSPAPMHRARRFESPLETIYTPRGVVQCHRMTGGMVSCQ